MSDVREIDSLYRSFPSFEEWARCSVDSARWNRYAKLIGTRGEASKELLRQAQEVARRAAAIDTGAIEGLYEVDRGFTFTVATQAFTWEAALDAKGSDVRSMIESQLEAYDYVIDAATGAEPLSEKWIRTLHYEMCKSQKTYQVVTEVGVQTQSLPLGEYKHLPNHVRSREDTTHAYAPVDLTPAEMHRLVNELRSEAFEAAHPVLQASYAHYAFVLIHPFADGNGRVARALASVFTYRAHSTPVLILAEHRNAYFRSLARADQGDLQGFVDFIMDRALDALRLVDESLRAAMAPRLSEAIGALERLYVTRSGYTHEEVDQAGYRLVELVLEELGRRVTEVEDGGRLVGEVHTINGTLESAPAGLRQPIATVRPVIQIELRTVPPAQATVKRMLVPLVPNDSGAEDDLVLWDPDRASPAFSVQISELMPLPGAILQMRLAMFSERFMAELIEEIGAAAGRTLRKAGY
jgi:Fic family protein